MRVLHVVGGYPTPERPHSQPFIKTQVDSLRKLGVECDVLVLKGRGPLKYLGGWWQVRARLGRGRVELLHAHYAYCAPACFGHGLPVVTSFLGSDLYGKPRADGGFSPWSGRLHLALCRFAAGRSAACIVKSERMRADLARDAHVIPNGVDLDFFRPAEGEERTRLRAELRFAPGTRYVLFAADPARPRKRFALAQAAVRQAAGRCDFPVELVAVHGRAHEDVARTMRAADLLLLTSSLEGSPNVVKEAMASGLRVVAVDVGDTRERLESVSGCRVTADDSPETIGDAVAAVLRSAEPAGGRAAVAGLRLEAVAERVSRVYASAIGTT
jgi:glycosyltransferase involved in cell wall biosynthesis